ncbi:hypothetical protein Hamer_G024501 [Homarus americanus]|uniref:Uncharacterized protein n=1 Tax=Homarus americanus TaxID=6706 RepID=A0A8J5JGN0_HOMAM|nr:hypothetical protein Hamer_G024501 [Homarus americanus]
MIRWWTRWNYLMLISNIAVSDFQVEEPVSLHHLAPKGVESGTETLQDNASSERVPIQSLDECLNEHLVAERGEQLEMVDPREIGSQMHRHFSPSPSLVAFQTYAVLSGRLYTVIVC